MIFGFTLRHLGGARLWLHNRTPPGGLLSNQIGFGSICFIRMTTLAKFVFIGEAQHDWDGCEKAAGDRVLVVDTETLRCGYWFWLNQLS